MRPTRTSRTMRWRRKAKTNAANPIRRKTNRRKKTRKCSSNGSSSMPLPARPAPLKLRRRRASSSGRSNRSTAAAPKPSTSTPSNSPSRSRRGTSCRCAPLRRLCPLVPDQGDAAADGLGFGQLQPVLGLALGEEAFALAEEDGEDHQAQLVDEVVFDQRLD